ncbi:MAG: MerR family transcriptional regulator [Sarcina sp.]
MEYTIGKLSEISGVTKRTLRYYDEIGILVPKIINESGYRIYTNVEIDKLQQILFYKNMSLSINEIKELLSNKSIDEVKVLENHYKNLLNRKEELESLIKNLEKTIKYKKGEIKMSNKEKFEALKKESIKNNENLYGKEIREKYGDKIINKSNKRYMSLSEEEFEEMNIIENKIFENLEILLKKEDSSLEEMTYIYHKKWLLFNWKKYSKTAHNGLAKMYLNDERFRAYYDQKAGVGATEILVKIIAKYTK